MADTVKKTPKPRTTRKKAVTTDTVSNSATLEPVSDTAPASAHTAEAKAKFSKALEEAKAGAAALGEEAKVRAGAYREKANAKYGEKKGEARVYGDDAKARAADLAREGKGKISEGLTQLSKVVSDNAATIDEKLGAKYGDYARTASRSLQENATKLDNKDLDELGEDAREFVRKSPGLAVGMAAVAGYMVARLFRAGR
jgi:ElaB/YqjD/DUF883 family membrane-anchored ribosome-binding protein